MLGNRGFSDGVESRVRFSHSFSSAKNALSAAMGFIYKTSHNTYGSSLIEGLLLLQSLWFSNWQGPSSLPWDFPDGSVVKDLSANDAYAGDVGSIPGQGRSPGGLQSMGPLRVRYL